jgi:hypothetical protein
MACIPSVVPALPRVLKHIFVLVALFWLTLAETKHQGYRFCVFNRMLFEGVSSVAARSLRNSLILGEKRQFSI